MPFSLGWLGRVGFSAMRFIHARQTAFTFSSTCLMGAGCPTFMAQIAASSAASASRSDCSSGWLASTNDWSDWSNLISPKVPSDVAIRPETKWLNFGILAADLSLSDTSGRSE